MLKRNYKKQLNLPNYYRTLSIRQFSISERTIFDEPLQHMKSVLECLSQLHGTGFAYKKSSGGKQKLQEEFPKVEVQIQLQDLIDTPDMRNHLRKYFRPFLHFLEDAEPVKIKAIQFKTG